MQDFTRIGGAITSAPLNDNFRRLNNNIDMTNTNILWDDEQGIVNTIDDMLAIKSPENGQACYVISSGELYRYYKKDNQWHKIMDIGGTFRQGFLNSGAVVLEDDIKFINGNTLSFPNMLIYFKNAPGDDRYLKGMYLIKATEQSFNLTTYGAYSVYVNKLGEFKLSTGLPVQDDPNNVFLGSFLVNKDNEIIEDFIYTLPDIAYTADRGNFIINGGQAEGLNLTYGTNKDGTANRNSGFYYDEGINYPKGDTRDFPYDVDNGSNFDLKAYEAQSPVARFYYITPKDCLLHEITETSELIFDKYWDGSAIVSVPRGYFTIQSHLVTPTGQNIIVYGDKLYNSMADGVSNINSTYGLEIDAPYVQATKIVIGNTGTISTNPTDGACQFFTVSRLAQVGTVSPVFADSQFRIYSGEEDSNVPATIWFDLHELQQQEFNELYDLRILPYTYIQDLFYSDKKYINDDITNPMDISTSRNRLIVNSDNPDIVNAGYYIADKYEVDIIKNRVEAIEKEIWDLYNNIEPLYNQSIRYRLYHAEGRITAAEDRIENHEIRITDNENNKVNKSTTINGHTLGDTGNKVEAKAIELVTGDIKEGGTNPNLWYTEDRVKANEDVVNATKHINSISKDDNANGHIKVNPHNISTDDINLLEDTKRLFVTADEERRIRADKLPDDTIKALQDLDEKIWITYILVIKKVVVKIQDLIL